MKMNKILFALLGLLCITLAACSDDDDYKWASAEGSQVYFSNELGQSAVEIDKSTTTITIPIYRVNTEGTITVPITYTCDNSSVSIPSSVTFEDGSNVAYITVTYDPDSFEYGDYTNFYVGIADEQYTTEYGLSYYDGTIGAAEPWSDWHAYNSDGTCTYTYTVFFSGDDPGLPFYVRDNLVQTNLHQFRIDNWGYGVSLYLEYDDETGNVTLDTQSIGYYYEKYSNYVWIAGFPYYYNLRGWGENSDYGTFDTEMGVIQIPVFYYLNDEAYSYGHFGYDYEYIQLGGFPDVSVAVAYAGKFVDTKENTSIIATATLGADVEKAYVALVQGDLTQEIYDQIKAGTYEPMQEVTESGDVYFDAAGLEAGDYTIVIVSFYNDEVQGYETSQFEYTLATADETFTDVYSGTYTYTLFFGSEESPEVTSGLTVSQSDVDGTRFKVADWGYTEDENAEAPALYFTFDGFGNVQVEECETGYTYGNYGMVYVQDLVGYTGGTKYGQSTYDEETGTFTFALIYYVEAGYFGMGTETLVISDPAVKAKLAQAKKDAQKKVANVTLNKKSVLAKKLSNNAPAAIIK